MYKIINCEQRSLEWFAARSGKITGSKVSELIMPKTLELSKSKQAKDLLFCAKWESEHGVCLDYHFDSIQTRQMQNGANNEYFANEYFLDQIQDEFSFDWCDIGFVEHNSGWFGISPDYVSMANGKILEGLEIKSAESKNTYITFLQIKNCEDLRALKFEWWCQCQLSMYVIGLKEWNFLGYTSAEDLPKKMIKVSSNKDIFRTFDKIINLLDND